MIEYSSTRGASLRSSENERTLTLPEPTLIETYPKQKRASLLLTLACALAFFICLGLRFIPPVNDALSGRPEYMRWIADKVAKSSAAR